MPPQEARAWWADVEHLREDFERRRARREGRDGERRPTPLHVVEGGRESAPRDRRPAAGPRGVTPAKPRSGAAEGRPAPGDLRVAPVAQALRTAADRLRATLAPPASDHEAPRPRLRSVEDPPAPAVAQPTTAPEAPRAPGGRRTVQIRGRLDDPPRPGPRRHQPPYRRPVTVGERLGARPDRVAGWAFAFCVLVILIAATTAGAATTLGERTLKRGMEGRDVRHLQLRLDRLGFYDGPANARFDASTQRAVSAYQRSRCLDADGVAGPATVRALRANRRACRGSQRSTSKPRPYVRTALGTRTLRRGDRGRDVRVLQRLVGMRSSGDFGPRTLRAVRRFQREAGLQGDGLVGPTTRGELAQRTMAVRGASWYGPGLYGNRTACGQELTTSLPGVAHRRLPCGTRVTLAHRGRFVTVPVVDRGPYVDGLTFDLTHATARTLGFSGTQALRARY